MDTGKVDLHVHSTESDGTLTPAQLINEAQAAGLSAMALTDHDTVDGIHEAKKAAEKSTVELVSGVELSTDYKGKEVHVVGLFIDEANPPLLKKLTDFRDNRDNRNVKMISNLQKEGFAITMESLYERFPDAVVTRAHMARYLFETGCVSSIAESFDKYLGDNCHCYVPREKIMPQEAIALIHGAGGLAILAHPILYHLTSSHLQELIGVCKYAGLDGIEAIYSTYQPGDERIIKKLAWEYGLKISGGSDFHGENKPHIRLGSGMGNLHIPASVLEELRALLPK